MKHLRKQVDNFFLNEQVKKQKQKKDKLFFNKFISPNKNTAASKYKVLTMKDIFNQLNLGGLFEKLKRIKITATTHKGETKRIFIHFNFYYRFPIDLLEKRQSISPRYLIEGVDKFSFEDEIYIKSAIIKMNSVSMQGLEDLCKYKFGDFPKEKRPYLALLDVIIDELNDLSQEDFFTQQRHRINDGNFDIGEKLSRILDLTDHTVGERISQLEEINLNKMRHDGIINRDCTNWYLEAVINAENDIKEVDNIIQEINLLKQELNELLNILASRTPLEKVNKAFKDRNNKIISNLVEILES